MQAGSCTELYPLVYSSPSNCSAEKLSTSLHRPSFRGFKKAERGLHMHVTVSRTACDGCQICPDDAFVPLVMHLFPFAPPSACRLVERKASDQ